MNQFDHFGIRFDYPDGWELDFGETEDGRNVTVNSPETSFWSISLFSGRPSIDSVLEAALAAYLEGYDEVDVSASEGEEAGTLGGIEAVARDVEFVCLELVNTACLRAISTEQSTVLVLYQGTDFELADTRGVLEKITQSLSLS